MTNEIRKLAEETHAAIYKRWAGLSDSNVSGIDIIETALRQVAPKPLDIGREELGRMYLMPLRETAEAIAKWNQLSQGVRESTMLAAETFIRRIAELKPTRVCVWRYRPGVGLIDTACKRSTVADRELMRSFTTCPFCGAPIKEGE